MVSKVIFASVIAFDDIKKADVTETRKTVMKASSNSSRPFNIVSNIFPSFTVLGRINFVYASCILESLQYRPKIIE